VPVGDVVAQPGPPPGLPGMPGDPSAAPPDPAIPEETVPGTYRIRAVGDIAPARGAPADQAISLMGVPLVAATWWSLLLGLYGYVLPFVLYTSWVAIAIWDLVRRETEPNRTRIGWIAVVLLVPFVGPLLYFALGRSPIPATMRLAVTAGGIVVYLVFVVIGTVLGG
jgi:Phospholipase_D-nuclease N-terminal